jgi:hypothetical protein
MKKQINTFIAMILLGGLLCTPAFAQDYQKLAQSGFQFLSVVSDAQGAAMAEAMTSLQTGSSSMFFNPAGMSEMTSFIDVSASLNQWIADIQHSTFSLAIRPEQGNYGVIGFSLQSVDYGDFFGTVVDQNTPLGYKDTETFNLTALAVGIGYAKALSDRFSVGGQVRWIEQNLGDTWVPYIAQQDEIPGLDTTKVLKSNKLSPLVFDFGTQFKTGIESLVFGMSVRNFSKEVKYVDEGFQAPLVFSLGLAMNLFDLTSEMPLNQALNMSVDASHYRDHPEQIKVGIEYKVMNILALRGGYVSNNDESGATYGIGISQFGFTFDYAYTPFGIFDKVHRMTARFAM